MDLRHLRPQSIMFSSREGIQDAVKLFLFRTNLMPGVRHAIGWRGAADTTRGCFAWTSRIKGRPGVFGLAYDRGRETGSWSGGVFRLHYFPWPNEELIESFSVKAAFLAQEPGYMERVRNFPQHPEFASVFHIADLQAAVHSSEKAVLLEVEGLSEHRVIADDGVYIAEGEEWTQIAAPGTCDQRFPSFQTACSFFHVFAASVTCNLEEPPCFLLARKYPGFEIHYDNGGGIYRKENKDVTAECLCLGYGDGDFPAGFGSIMDRRRDKELEELVWTKGEAGLDAWGYDDALWWTAHRFRETGCTDGAGSSNGTGKKT